MLNNDNKINFASDNYAGIHPHILQAIQNCNEGSARAYGEDGYTVEAIEMFKKTFGDDIVVYFLFNGTGANVLSLSHVLQSYEAIICAENAHINSDETGSIENFSGSKLLTIKTNNGKITVQDIKNKLVDLHNYHKVQPKVISITQSTEFGTLYSREEIIDITHFAHENNLYVHIDGSRLSNAASAMHCSLKELTIDLNIDILSFGGTKNGMMLGEAVIFFDKKMAEGFKYRQKQGMQLCSKMRFISAQFIALLTDNVWHKNATHANKMATFLYQELQKIPQIKIDKKVEVNAVFIHIDEKFISPLQEKYHFYVWNKLTSEIRLMTSWQTTEADICNFIKDLKRVLQETKN